MQFFNQSRLRGNIVIHKSFWIYAFRIIPEKPFEELLKIFFKNIFFEVQTQKLLNFKKFFSKLANFFGGRIVISPRTTSFEKFLIKYAFNKAVKHIKERKQRNLKLHIPG